MSMAEFNAAVRKFKMPGNVTPAQIYSRDITGIGGFPTKAARSLVDTYMVSDYGDITIPNNALGITDSSIENTANDMGSTDAWRSLDIVSIQGGMAANPDGTMSKRDDRKAIWGVEKKTGARFIMDPRISTLSGGDKSLAVDDEYVPGVTPFGDGVYVDLAVKYCSGAAMLWDGVVDSNGHEIYERPVLDRWESDKDIKFARSNIAQNGVPPMPAVDYSMMSKGKRKTVSREEAEKSLSRGFTDESEYYPYDNEEYTGFDFGRAEKEARRK